MAERSSSSLHRGLRLSVLNPLAMTSPIMEFFSSWVTTSGAGTAVRETVKTSSSS